MMVRVPVGMILVVMQPVMVVVCVTVMLMGMNSVLIALTSQQESPAKNRDHHSRNQSDPWIEPLWHDVV